MTRKRVVLTGAAGHVGQRMLEALQQRYDLVCVDVADPPEGQPGANWHRLDLSRATPEDCREAFRGADAVVHCATLRGRTDVVQSQLDSWGSRGPSATMMDFQTHYANVGMAYTVYRAAQLAGVPRVVMASSNHAADWFERLWHQGRCELVTPDMPPLSDNFYGWSKASYELLGFVFATGKAGGTPLEVVCWRIGNPRDSSITALPDDTDPAMARRAYAVWLSAADQAQQCIRMIETEDIRDTNGVPFAILYGISRNANRFWSLTDWQRRIGWLPESDSQDAFADRLPVLLGRMQRRNG